MKRTQIYLLESQKESLDILAKQKGKSVAELIREAVDRYVIDSKRVADDPINQTSGLWADRNDIPDSEKYIMALRKEMDSHLEENEP